MHRIVAAAAIAALYGFGVSDAAAAPQVLGIVASNGPVPMLCDAQGCRADLSTFCLQQPRANPAPGQHYELAAGSSVTLVGTKATGEMVRLPAATHLRFVSDRGFTAVEVALPASALAELGLVAVAVEVERQASLVPVQSAGDSDPQTAEELDLALGAYRAQGSRFFDDAGEAGDAIRLTNLMINDLPKSRRQRSDTDGHLLQVAASSAAAAVADPLGLDLARTYHDSCVTKVDVTHHVDSMRACLQGTHDRLVTRTNIDFWRSLGSY